MPSGVSIKGRANDVVTEGVDHVERVRGWHNPFGWQLLDAGGVVENYSELSPIIGQLLLR